MVNFDYDCSGWATRAGVQCYDGLTIAQDAFKENNGQVVPMVYNHDHSSIDNVIGHCLLENRKGGVYAYAKFNDTPAGKTARDCVENGDLNAFSIFANGLRKAGQTVMHGCIKEVSLVLAGCNPGALIDEVVKHSLDEDYDGGEAYIYNEPGLSLKHGIDPEDKEDDEMAESGKTLEDIYNSMTPEQQEACNALVGLALEEGAGDEGDPEDDNYDEEDDNVKHNVFDGGSDEQILKHSMDEINSIIQTANKHGTLRDAFLDAGISGDELAHSIDNLDYLFPEDHNLDPTPRIIDRDQTWVGKVMNGVHHVPFGRVKVMFADLTEDDARAKGYIKGNYKKEQVFPLLKRTTTPTTVYKKQRFDRDDVVDMGSFDVVSFVKVEQRGKLNEELATAYLVGDGRDASSDDKINELNIRPIAYDDDFYTIKVIVAPGANADENAKAKATIRAIIKARKNYKGSGNPTFYTTDDVLTDMLLLEDNNGRTIYDEASLARKLRVKEIVTVPRMEGRKGAKGGDLLGIIVNLADYTVGADKGGAVNMFDDFNIDYNQMVYLIETRCSGALTVPFGAMAIEMDKQNSAQTV